MINSKIERPVCAILRQLICKQFIDGHLIAQVFNEWNKYAGSCDASFPASRLAAVYARWSSDVVRRRLRNYNTYRNWLVTFTSIVYHGCYRCWQYEVQNDRHRFVPSLDLRDGVAFKAAQCNRLTWHTNGLVDKCAATQIWGLVPALRSDDSVLSWDPATSVHCFPCCLVKIQAQYSGPPIWQ